MAFLISPNVGAGSLPSRFSNLTVGKLLSP